MSNPSNPSFRPTFLPDVPGYQVDEAIGRGSMGTVYRATPDEGGEAVAIKVLHIDGIDEEMAFERFTREVQAAGKIGHRGIPTVYDAGQLADGRLYLAMEMLVGCDLEDWWDDPRHTRLEALHLLASAMEPLAAAHEAGIIHRDLKPENVYVVDSGDPPTRLLDFGIARDLSGDHKKRTATGVALGTPVYMSPEQATKPSDAGPSTDVWSLGVMMYETLCGELPFDGESPHAVVIKVCTDDPVPLQERSPSVHEDLVALVHECLSKDPYQRPADAGELRHRLMALLTVDEVQRSLGGSAATPDFGRELTGSSAERRAVRRSSDRPGALVPTTPSSNEGNYPTLGATQHDLTEPTALVASESSPRWRLPLVAAAALLLAGGAAWGTRMARDNDAQDAETSPVATMPTPEAPDVPEPGMDTPEQVDVEPEAFDGPSRDELLAELERLRVEAEGAQEAPPRATDVPSDRRTRPTDRAADRATARRTTPSPMTVVVAEPAPELPQDEPPLADDGPVAAPIRVEPDPSPIATTVTPDPAPMQTPDPPPTMQPASTRPAAMTTTMRPPRRTTMRRPPTMERSPGFVTF